MAQPSRRLPPRPSLEQLRNQAKDALRQLRQRNPAATLADAQFALARDYGFDSWPKLVQHVESARASAWVERSGAFYRIDAEHNTIEPRPPLSDADWDTVFALMKEREITGINAPAITDRAMERLARLDFVTRVNVGGARLLTDDGLTYLARLGQLEELDLSGWDSAITDRGLEVLRHLPNLRRFQMCWPQRVSDAGVANLTFCDRLETVDLMGTPTGDGAINALRGKRALQRFKTGRLVTDAGIPLLHDYPVFKRWQGGEIKYDLMSFDAEPNGLLLDGPFTNRGLAGLAGLEGLFGLNLFWHCPSFTGGGLAALAELPNLGFLGCHGERCDDVAMRHIAAIPRLRMLMGQGTVASDDGFAALSRSRSIEYIWGRECPGLTGRGFAALAVMPALRGLAVSCKNVDDRALGTLPGFPALTDLLPMDVSDDGFRHVGRCERLERLWCMYCRDTGDAATGYLAGLSRLRTYYAGRTQITDRSLEILGRIGSLEVIELWETAGVTNAGLAALARLPRLREVTLEGLPHVTRAGVGAFPARVRVTWS